MVRPVHVAIVLPRYARLIVAGHKTVEARLTITRRPPFGCIRAGDRVYVRVRSGGYVAVASVGQVKEFTLRGAGDVERLRDRFQAQIMADDAFWGAKADARYATLMWLERVEPVRHGPNLAGVVPAGSRSAWHVVPGDLDVYPECVDSGLFEGFGPG